MSTRSPPFGLGGAVYLLAGLVLAVYHGLEQFNLVPRAGPLSSSWISWGHIHFVTIAGFTQLLVGLLPVHTARILDRPMPPKCFMWANFLGLNGGFLLLWYGRGWNHPWAFDLGLYAIWLLVAGLLVMMLKMVMQSDRAWNATVGLYLTSVFIFLWGITYAYGLFAHLWQVPGGWLGLRESHVHANAWGFLGLAVIGTLYDVFPRIIDIELHSERLKNYSVWFFIVGIFPLITGPWLGMGRTITATGLVLYAAGFALYLYNLVRTYGAAESRSGIASSVLAAQIWLLGPAGFAPFVLFGIEWVRPPFIEDGALHFFFLGWALPIALAGLLLYFRNLPTLRESQVGAATRGPPSNITRIEHIPTVISTWMIWAWNLGVLLVGIGFFYQDQPWSAYVFGPGYTIIALLWLYLLTRAFQYATRSFRHRTVDAVEANP